MAGDTLSKRLAEREAQRKAAAALHRGTPAQNEAIERRISDEVTADALARKLAREAKPKT